MLPTINGRSNNSNNKKSSFAAVPSQRINNNASTNKTRLNASQSRYTCNRYNHECFLPDYKLLSIPRTNNYYAMTGGCPCLPRAAAHPGSERLTADAVTTQTKNCHCHSNHKKGQEYAIQVEELQEQENAIVCNHANSDVNKGDTPTCNHIKENTGIITMKNNNNNNKTTNVNASAYKSTHLSKTPHSANTACPSCTRLYKSNSHYTSDYGRIRGPHLVHLKNTAIHGKCDTFGNLAFTSSATLPSKYNQSNLNDEKEKYKQHQEEMLTLQGDLEALILDEHVNRIKVESDIAELNDLNALGKVDVLKDKQLKAARLRELSAVTEEELNHLLNNIHTIVHEPLNQTNMERVQRTLQREREMQRCRDLIAAKKLKEETMLENLEKTKNN